MTTDATSGNTISGASFAVVDGFVVDCTLSESHTFEAEVTDYPVESGASISDNMRVKPMTVTLHGIVSSTPLAPVAATRDDPSLAPKEAYQHFLAIRNANPRRLVQILTSLDSYQNMALVELDVPRNAGNGSHFEFTAKFQQVQFVSVAKAQPSIPTASAQKKVTRALKVVPGTGTFNIIKVGQPDAVDASTLADASLADDPVLNARYDPGDVLWFDKNIDGWRWSGHFSQALQKWVFFRGQPFGFGSDWAFSGDVGVRKTLDAGRDVAKYDPIQVYRIGNGLATNPKQKTASGLLVSTVSGVVIADEGVFRGDALASAWGGG